MTFEVPLLSALRSLANASTADDGALVVVEDDVRIDVTSHAMQSSATVCLATPYDASARAGGIEGATGSYREPGPLRGVRPMQITLRAETSADREGKASGLNVEVDTGDGAFDEAVYVDSPTTDTALLRAVLGADARAAILDLFALRVGLVVLDDLFHNIRVELTGFPTLTNDDDRAVKLVQAFGRLARALPRVRATGKRHGTPPWFGRIAAATMMAGLGGIAMPIAFLYVAQAFGGTTGIGLSHLVIKDGYGLPRLIGFIGALLFGFLAIPTVRRWGVPKLRGRSDSRPRIRYLYGVAFVLFAEVGFVVGTAIGLSLIHISEPTRPY